jgi:hypothetical protein
MKSYENKAFEKLIILVRNENKDARAWLVENDYRELAEFWDALDGIEPAFKWLLNNNYRQLAATVDAMNGDDKAKVFLLKTGNRELAAFVEASEGSQNAVSWLLRGGHHGWVLLAKELFDRDKKKEKSFWSLFNFGNPFR